MQIELVQPRSVSRSRAMRLPLQFSTLSANIRQQAFEIHSNVIASHIKVKQTTINFLPVTFTSAAYYLH